MSLDDLELNVNSIKKDRLPEILRRRTWMRFILTVIMFGSFFWVVWLLFTDLFTYNYLLNHITPYNLVIIH